MGGNSYFCTAHLLPWPVPPGDWKEAAAAAREPLWAVSFLEEARRAPTWGSGGQSYTRLTLALTPR